MIHPSTFFMERVFSILRACLDEMQETCYYSDRIRASTLLKYNRGRFFFLYQGCSSLYCCAVYPYDIAVCLRFSVLNLESQYYCSGVNVERVRVSTLSLGAVGPREFDLLTPATQHNVLLFIILKYPSSTKWGICPGVVCTQMFTLHTCIHIHALNTAL